MLDYTKEELLELGLKSRLAKSTNNRKFGKKPIVFIKRKKKKSKSFRDHWEASWLHQGHLDRCGTSAYVGDTLVPYLQEVHDERHWNFQSIATTDIVAHPQTYLKKKCRRSWFPLHEVATRLKVLRQLSWLKTWSMNSIRSPLPVRKKGSWLSRLTEMSAISCSSNQKKPMMLALP